MLVLLLLTVVVAVVIVSAVAVAVVIVSAVAVAFIIVIAIVEVHVSNVLLLLQLYYCTVIIAAAVPCVFTASIAV